MRKVLTQEKSALSFLIVAAFVVLGLLIHEVSKRTLILCQEGTAPPLCGYEEGGSWIAIAIEAALLAALLLGLGRVLRALTARNRANPLDG